MLYPEKLARGMENGMIATFRGDLARWKRKMKGLNFPGDFARRKKKRKVSTSPGDFARWKEKIKISTAQAISPAGRRR